MCVSWEIDHFSSQIPTCWGPNLCYASMFISNRCWFLGPERSKGSSQLPARPEYTLMSARSCCGSFETSHFYKDNNEIQSATRHAFMSLGRAEGLILNMQRWRAESALFFVLKTQHSVLKPHVPVGVCSYDSLTLWGPWQQCDTHRQRALLPTPGPDWTEFGCGFCGSQRWPACSSSSSASESVLCAETRADWKSREKSNVTKKVSSSGAFTHESLRLGSVCILPSHLCLCLLCCCRLSSAGLHLSACAVKV